MCETLKMFSCAFQRQVLEPYHPCVALPISKHLVAILFA